MQPEVKNLLQLAFSYLNAFGVPKVGTFRKAYVPAEANLSAGKINPPGESFVLEPSDDGGKVLERFFASRFHIEQVEAANWVRQISWTLMGELEVNGKYPLEGVGELVRSGNDVELNSRKAQTGAFYGFSDLSLESQTQVEKERQPVVTRQENETVKEIPFFDYRLNGIDEKKRKIPYGLLILLLLIAGLGYAGYYFRSDISRWVDSLTHSTTQPVADNKPEDKGSSETENATPIPPQENHTASPSTEHRNHPVKKRDAAVSNAPVDESNVGANPKKDHYYLIVKSTRTGAEALEFSKTLNQGKYTIRILKPTGGLNLYRISVFDHDNKQEVIRHMVQWKNDFAENSWIFYLGM